jgi:hypothetical protein
MTSPRVFLRLLAGVLPAAWVAAMMLAVPAAHAQSLDELRAQWAAKRWADVIQPLLDYRKRPYGRDAEVDYMIATACCRSQNLRDMGQKFFAWTLASYSLDAEQRITVTAEMQDCQARDEARRLGLGGGRGTGGTSEVRGKTFYWLNAPDSALTSDPVRVTRQVPRREFAARLYPAQDGDRAVRYFQQLAGTGFTVQLVGGFIVAGASSHSPADLQDMARALDGYRRFFASEYRMPLPEYLVTVYVVPDPRALQRVADRLHGLSMSSMTIGYSFREDLSIVAVVPRGAEIARAKGPHGTVAHELFHLMVRNNFGDIPPWLDEGLAALYEVSAWRGDRIDGLPNWRGPVLKKFWAQRPPVARLVRMNWTAFDDVERRGETEEPRQQAANHAMARYFVLYLQTKGQLAGVYRAFRERRVEDLKGDPTLEATQLLEATLGRALGEVDGDFERWFRTVGGE